MNGREKAFVSNEFKEYNPRVERHVQKLLGIIRDTGGRTANCYSLMGHLTFDVLVIPPCSGFKNHLAKDI